jgi:hypothetical protein
LLLLFSPQQPPPGFPSHGFPEFGSLSVRKDLRRRRFQFLRRAAVRPAAGPSGANPLHLASPHASRLLPCDFLFWFCSTRLDLFVAYASIVRASRF